MSDDKPGICARLTQPRKKGSNWSKCAEALANPVRTATTRATWCKTHTSTTAQSCVVQGAKADLHPELWPANQSTSIARSRALNFTRRHGQGWTLCLGLRREGRELGSKRLRLPSNSCFLMMFLPREKESRGANTDKSAMRKSQRCNACTRYARVRPVLLHALYYVVVVLVFKVQG